MGGGIVTTIKFHVWKDNEEVRDILAWIRGMESRNPGMFFVQLQALYECHFAQSPNDSGTFCGDEYCPLCTPQKKSRVKQ